jgi:hypothetical protein
MTPRDIFDQPLAVGDQVLFMWTHGSGSSSSMTELTRGTIKAVTDKTVLVSHRPDSRYPHQDYRVQKTRIRQMVLIPSEFRL